MKASLATVALTLGLGSACFGGCSAEHVTAVDESWALVSEGEPVSGDPWGVCDLMWTCSIPDAGCFGWVEPGSCPGVEGDDGCDLTGIRVACLHWCETKADCPVPLTGDAPSLCADGRCVLSCGDGVTCPNGSSCVASRESSASESPYSLQICMQAYAPADVDRG